MPSNSRQLNRSHVYDSPNQRMAGKELRRLRVAANLSESELARRIGTYRVQIQRWQKAVWFYLTKKEMNQVLKSLGEKYEG